MAEIYADLIRKKLKTIDQVPEFLRKEVERLLLEANQWSN